MDGTLGGGGLAQAVLEKLLRAGRLFGIDRDGEAIAEASPQLEAFGMRSRRFGAIFLT